MISPLLFYLACSVVINLLLHKIFLLVRSKPTKTPLPNPLRRSFASLPVEIQLIILEHALTSGEFYRYDMVHDQLNPKIRKLLLAINLSRVSKAVRSLTLHVLCAQDAAVCAYCETLSVNSPVNWKHALLDEHRWDRMGRVKEGWWAAGFVLPMPDNDVLSISDAGPFWSVERDFLVDLVRFIKMKPSRDAGENLVRDEMVARDAVVTRDLEVRGFSVPDWGFGLG